MNEDDIKELLKLLKKSVKKSDWDLVIESIEFLEDLVEDDSDEEEI